MKNRLSISLLTALLAPVPLSLAVDFTKDVRPILSQNCFKCHGGPRAKKDFQMDRPEKFKEQIGPGKYIIPGDPAGSEVIQRITLPPDDTNRMPPPKKGQPLTEGEINVIRTWIQEGALLEPKTDAPATPQAPDPASPHTWTSVKGTSLKAYFVRVEGSNVILRSEDGQEKPFPIALFSDESKALIQTLSSR